MKLVLRLAHLKCCELSRPLAFEEYHDYECGWSHAYDVYKHGWEGSKWFGMPGPLNTFEEYRYGGGPFRQTFFWSTLTGDDIHGDGGYEAIITKESAQDLSKPTDEGISALAPLLGARVTRGLRMVRGIEDLPADWESLFNSPFAGT